MASDPSASKKRRIDSLEDSPSPGEHLEEPVDEKWTRQQDLYFEDATIVLLSSDGRPPFYHSDIFKGMFSLSPHQPAQAEKYDDCPLIRLTDNSDELVYFSKAIMHSDYADDSQSMNPRAMAPILRFSKYFVQFMRRRMWLRFRRTSCHGSKMKGLKKRSRTISQSIHSWIFFGNAMATRKDR
ncbi:hypothetical protein M422DRAFT_37083 [Sphaerobolus stellatus SS14]|uniref:BTB domain-containing protein n=1 Tax=Sphaerobolus stellatus (strain SS14) TaxID=990650 RepID=A0A0C9UUY7_SPHS4|nr:hypothetical protein M422DRAFT_37083 [Sphaerobolus stellatus SS14]